MPIAVNPSGTVKDVSGLWVNPSGTLKECTGVWVNIDGTMKQVWPLAHTAFDGIRFKGALKGGLRSGINYYCSLYIDSTTGTVARTNKIYSQATGEFTGSPEDQMITSGTASFGFRSTTRDDYYLYYCGYISVNLVNLSPYDTITVKVKQDSESYSNSSADGMLKLCLTNAAGNGTTTLDPVSTSGDYSGCTMTFNVSSIRDKRYIGFIFRLSARSTNYSYEKYDQRHITEISFA